MQTGKLVWMSLLATALWATGCASMFMAGSNPVSGPPASPEAVCKVPTCTMVSDNSQTAGPANQTYYLGREGHALVLFELDQGHSGAKITNHWSDEQGDHFFTYVRTSHGWEYIIPRDRSQPGVRLVYPKGTYATGTVNGTTRVVQGSPMLRCPLVCQAARPQAVARATVATQPAPPEPAADPPPPPPASTAEPGSEQLLAARAQPAGATPASDLPYAPDQPEEQPAAPTPESTPASAPVKAEPSKPAVVDARTEPSVERDEKGQPNKTKKTKKTNKTNKTNKTKKKRNTLWLVTSIAAGAAAAGCLIWGAATSTSGVDAAEAGNRDGFDGAVTRQRVAYGLSIGLGAAAATSLVLYLVTGKEQRVTNKDKSTSLAAGPGDVGLSARWRF
jgi:hypothetical protein